MSISVLINDTLSQVVTAYPVIADIDKGVRCPFASYRVKHSGTATKEGTKKSYEIGIFLVDETFDEVDALAGRVEKIFYKLRDAGYTVSTINYSIDYDTDDRKYICEMNFTIKNL